MVKKMFLLILFLPLSGVYGQSLENTYRIKISDNRNNQYTSYDYVFKNDSLKIMGLADYGKRTVEYYTGKLPRKAQKAIKKYLANMHPDLLEKEYFDDFTSFGYISADHFPRVIEIEFRQGFVMSKTKITNCWVGKVSDLFQFLNNYIPTKEVKLLFSRDDFKKHY